MSKIVLDVSVSLDGFSAGPNVRQAELIPEGKPVAGAATHLRYRVA